jgi:antitoxin (DNA-binding transcriptional repressor) of toxin-antitoxin stability system
MMKSMVKLNIHEAKTHLSKHLELLESGEEDVIVICRRNEPIAELRPLTRKTRRRKTIFTRDPRFKLSPRFHEPLPSEIVDAFEGRAR